MASASEQPDDREVRSAASDGKKVQDDRHVLLSVFIDGR
jgi:hypothetical protein